MSVRTLRLCQDRHASLLAQTRWLDGKCWHGLGDLFEQQALIHDGAPIGANYARQAGEAYQCALDAYEADNQDKTKVDRLAIFTDLAMLDIRSGAIDEAHRKLDLVQAQEPLPTTVAARLSNRRAWAFVKEGEVHRAQRFVKEAARMASDANDPLLMSMAEVLRYEFYKHLGLSQKAATQYEHVLDWVQRDGIRHAEVLQTFSQDDAYASGGHSHRLGWLLNVPWLQTMISLLAIVALGGCMSNFEPAQASPAEQLTGALGSDNVLLNPASLEPGSSKVASDPKCPASSDPKKPASSDPKKPAASDPKKPDASDPKKPAASNPKKPDASDPKNPKSSDPKVPKGSDPKTGTSSSSSCNGSGNTASKDTKDSKKAKSDDADQSDGHKAKGSGEDEQDDDDEEHHA
jgi:hypothetical protein